MIDGEDKKGNKNYNQLVTNNFVSGRISFLNVKKNPLLYLFLAGIFLNLFGVFLLFKNILPSESGIILHYNSFLGIDVIVFDLKEKYYQLFFISIGGFLILLFNLLLALLINWNKKIKKIKNKEITLVRKTVAIFLSVGALLVQMAILIYILAIIKVNS